MDRYLTGIATKLVWLTLFNLLGLLVVIMIIETGFNRVESLSTNIAGKQVELVIDNAQLVRQLSATFSDIDHLRLQCRKRAPDPELQTRLSKSLSTLAGSIRDPQLTAAFAKFKSSASLLLSECETFSQHHYQLRKIDRQIETTLSQLEDSIGHELIEQTLAGNAVDHLDQLMVLTAGLRETQLVIGKLIAEMERIDANSQTSSSQTIELADDMSLRLQTMIGATPAIEEISQLLSIYLIDYRATYLDYQASRQAFYRHADTSRETGTRVIDRIDQLDKLAAGRAVIIQDEISSIVNDSRVRVIGLSILVALSSIFLIIWLNHRGIQQPLSVILDMIRSIQKGEQPITSGSRNDEWGDIQTALSNMSGDLKQAYRELSASQERLSMAVQGANDGIWDWNLDNDEIYYSPRWKSMLGYEENELAANLDTWIQLIDPLQIDDIQQKVSDFLEGRATSYNCEFRMRHKDGHWVEILSRGTLARDSEGKLLHPRRFVGTHIDVTARKQAEDSLKLAASVFSHANEGILITDPDGTVIDMNQACLDITGYDRDELIGNTPDMLGSKRRDKTIFSSMWEELFTKGNWSGEVLNQRKDKSSYTAMLTITAVRNDQGELKNFISHFFDITAQKEYQQQLEHNAHFDSLTGLPNRTLLADRLHDGMTLTQRRNLSLAVIYLDLDGFKEVNDTYGHDAGDRLLIKVATRMKRILREGDSLARLGGDEFVAVLLDIPNLDTCAPMLTRLLEAAATDVRDNGNILRVSASLGVTFYPQQLEIDADQLLRQADQAMYQAKLAGKNRYHIFNTEQDIATRGHHESLEKIRSGLDRKEFSLYYQPKVNMRSGDVIGLEALIRWHHPQRGLVLPDDFLPVIENHALALEVHQWVLQEAFKQMAQWHSIGLRLPVSINISAQQIQQTGFFDSIQATLDQYPEIDPEELELEVLESSALDDLVQATEMIQQFCKIGVNCAIDDFGTGYSSLTYLKHLPVKTLKIDRSFVSNMLDNQEDLMILKGILGLAQAFQRKTIAEGVETIAHGAALLDMNCELGQGYSIAHPMPASDVPAWLENWRLPQAWADRQQQTSQRPPA